MAEFCNKCTERLFGKNAKPDIDVMEIAKDLAPGGEGLNVLCEGCGLRFIYKDESDRVLVAVSKEENKEGFMSLMTYEEYIAEAKRLKGGNNDF